MLPLNFCSHCSSPSLRRYAPVSSTSQRQNSPPQTCFKLTTLSSSSLGRLIRLSIIKYVDINPTKFYLTSRDSRVCVRIYSEFVLSRLLSGWSARDPQRQRFPVLWRSPTSCTRMTSCDDISAAITWIIVNDLNWIGKALVTFVVLLKNLIFFFQCVYSRLFWIDL